MIVHEVKIAKPETGRHIRGRHKTIYVGSAKADLKYRDMIVYGRQRWEFYTNGTLDFTTCDHNGLKPYQYKQTAERKIIESDGVMMVVSKNTVLDDFAVWEIDFALYKNVPIVGIDVRFKSEGKIPPQLVGKMTKYGWEWFAGFINKL